MKTSFPGHLKEDYHIRTRDVARDRFSIETVHSMMTEEPDAVEALEIIEAHDESFEDEVQYFTLATSRVRIIRLTITRVLDLLLVVL